MGVGALGAGSCRGRIAKHVLVLRSRASRPRAGRICTTRRATSRSRRSTFFSDGRGSRTLVANTVARGTLREDEHLYAGKIDGQLTDMFPDAGDRRGDGARPRALQRVLLAVPRPDGAGQRHGGAARVPRAAVVPRGAAAQRAGRLFLRRADQRLRRHVGLRGAGAGGRPLGDRRVHPRAAVQPARHGRRRACRAPSGPRRAAAPQEPQ